MAPPRQVRPPEDEAGRMRIAAGYGSKSSAELFDDVGALNEMLSLDGLPDNLRPMLQEFLDMTKLAVTSRANPARRLP